MQLYDQRERVYLHLWGPSEDKQKYMEETKKQTNKTKHQICVTD